MARKIILREDGINNTINTPSGYKFLGYDDDTLSEKAGATVSEIGGGSLYIEVTKAELDILITASELVVGFKYKVTGVDPALYGGTDIFVDAILPNKISETGNGIFYTPKYNLTVAGYDIWTTYMNGTFTNILGTFVNGENVTAQNGAKAIYLAEGLLNYASGDWSGATEISGGSGTCEVSGFISPSYSIGNKRHWGGMTWTNVNGLVGKSINKYTLNAEWSVIPFDDVEYNVYIDEIKYDYENDMIISRKDRYNNEVSGNNQIFIEFEDPGGYGYGNPIKDFQWGNAQDDFNTTDYFYIGTQQNKVIDSYFDCLNSLANYIWGNKLNQLSTIRENIYSINGVLFNNTLTNFCEMIFNNLSYGSIRENNLVNGTVKNNTLDNLGAIIDNMIVNSSIHDNNLSGGSIRDNNLSGSSNIQSNNVLSIEIARNNLVNGSGIRANTLSGGDSITDNTLNRSVFRFTNISGKIRSSFANGFNTKSNTIDIAVAPILYTESVSKNLFDRLDGTPRMSYVNDLDVTVIGAVTM